jgi:parallel beta-helix repeat protein
MIEYSDTDATNVIQYAIDALTNGGRIFIRRGVYNISNTIVLRNPAVVLEGESFIDAQVATQRPGTVLVLMDNVNKDMIEVTAEKCVISNMKLYGNKYRNTNGRIIYEHAGTSSDLKLEKLYVIAAPQQGVWLEGNYITAIDVATEISGDWGWVIKGNISRLFGIASWGDAKGVLILGVGNIISSSLIYGDSQSTIGLALGDESFVAEPQRNIVVGNIISDVGQEGIRLVGAHENIISSNVIVDAGKSADNTYDAIIIKKRVFGSYRNIIIGNRIYSGRTNLPRYGINIADADSDYNMIIGNMITDVRTGAINSLAPNTLIRNNIGYVNQNSGVATISAGSTRVTVSHGLATTPGKVLITPLGQPPGKLWVENITSTSFDIVTDTAPSANLNVAWYAEV